MSAADARCGLFTPRCRRGPGRLRPAGARRGPARRRRAVVAERRSRRRARDKARGRRPATSPDLAAGRRAGARRLRRLRPHEPHELPRRPGRAGAPTAAAPSAAGAAGGCRRPRAARLGPVTFGLAGDDGPTRLTAVAALARRPRGLRRAPGGARPGHAPAPLSRHPSAPTTWPARTAPRSVSHARSWPARRSPAADRPAAAGRQGWARPSASPRRPSRRWSSSTRARRWSLELVYPTRDGERVGARGARGRRLRRRPGLPRRPLSSGARG